VKKLFPIVLLLITICAFSTGAQAMVYPSPEDQETWTESDWQWFAEYHEFVNEIPETLNSLPADNDIFKAIGEYYGAKNISAVQGSLHPDMNSDGVVDERDILTLGYRSTEKKIAWDPGQIYAPTTGNIRIPILLVEFDDYPASATHTPQWYQNNRLDGSTESCVDFYQVNSYGQLNITYDVYGWFTMPKNKSYYDNSWNNIRELARAAVDEANSSVDFSLYDNDGDQVVDVYYVFFAGQKSSSTPFWPHWSISGQYFQQKDGVYLAPYILIDEYTHMGTIVHEFGHAMSFPDLYDTTYNSEGIGGWGVMSAGSWGGGNGWRPTNFCAPAKDYFGWIDPVVVQNNMYDESIGNSYDNAIAYRLWTNGLGGSQFFLVENKRKKGYDASLPSEGLMIWHVDNTKFADGNSDVNRKYIDVEEADGHDDLDNKSNSGDAGDPYRSGDEFNDSTYPNSRSYANSTTMVGVQDVSGAGDTMTADLLVEAEGLFPFFDDMEFGPNNWEVESGGGSGSFMLTTSDSYSPTTCWEESSSQAESDALIIKSKINLSEAFGPELRFFAKHSFSDTNRVRVQVSENDGDSWMTMMSVTGAANDWTAYSSDLGSWKGESIMLRFLFDADSASANWFRLDDVWIGEGNADYPFFDDFEDGSGDWDTEDNGGGGNGSVNGDWHLVTSDAISATHSFWIGDDSQGGPGNYEDDELSTRLVDLAQSNDPQLTFWYRMEAEQGSDGGILDVGVYDWMTSDWTWTELKQYSEEDNIWRRDVVDLDQFQGEMVRIRFTYISNAETHLSGWWLDDVSIDERPLIYPLDDDMENGEDYWEIYDKLGYPDNGYWHRVTTDAHESSTSFWCGNDALGETGDREDDTLTSVRVSFLGVDVPIFRFWHKYDIEESYDSAFVEMELSESGEWTVLDEFTGSIPTWQKVEYDFSPYYDQIVRVRFRFESDNNNQGDPPTGWFIDDVFIGEETSTDPHVQFVSPSNNSDINGPTDVHFSAEHKDGVQRLVLFVNGGKVYDEEGVSEAHFMLDSWDYTNGTELTLRAAAVGGDDSTGEEYLYLTAVNEGMIGDTNLDGRVNSADVTRIGIRFGAELGDSEYKAYVDTNEDGTVDELDLTPIALNYGDEG